MTDDPIRLLADLNPVDEEQVPDGHSQQAEAALQRALDQPPIEVVGGGSRRRLWPLVPIAALLALGATWILAQPAESPQWVSCYREAGPDADRAALHLNPGEQHPVEACAEAWASGDLWPESPPRSLTACVSDTGVIAVLPGEDGDLCGRLGWAPLDLDGTALDVARLSAAVRARHEEHRCLDEREARGIARGLLRELALEDWRVDRVEADAGDSPCMTIAVAAGRRVLLLVPLEPLSSP